jgi:hypothetical protein
MDELMKNAEGGAFVIVLAGAAGAARQTPPPDHAGPDNKKAWAALRGLQIG